MDFSWVGNIKKKVEAICDDLDKSVTQDKAKYVKNQLHSAGDGLRKLYSNVQDLLAPCETDLVDQRAISDSSNSNEAESEVAPVELDSIFADQKSDTNVQENVFSELHPECQPISLSSMNYPGISESESPVEQNVNALLNGKLDVRIDGSATEVISHLSKNLDSKNPGDNMIETSASSTNSVIDIDNDLENTMATPISLDPIAANCLRDNFCEVYTVDQHVTTSKENLLKDVEPEVAPGPLGKTLAEKDDSSCEVRALDQHMTTSSENLVEDAEDVEPEVAPGQLDELFAEKDDSSSEVCAVDQDGPRASENLLDDVEPELDKSLAEKVDSSCEVCVLDQHVSTTSENLLEDFEPEVAPVQQDKTMAEKDDSSSEVHVVDQHVTTASDNLVDDVENVELEVAPGQLEETLADNDADIQEIAVNEPHLEHQLISLSSMIWPRLSESDSSLGGNVDTLLNEMLDVSINESVTKKLTHLSEPLGSKHPGDNLIVTSATGEFIDDDCKYTSLTLKGFVPPLSVHDLEGPPFKSIGTDDSDHASGVPLSLTCTQMAPCIACLEDKATETAFMSTKSPPVKKSCLSELLRDNYRFGSKQIRAHLEEPECSGDRLVTGLLLLPDQAASSENKLADIAPDSFSNISSDANAAKVNNTKVGIDLSGLQRYQFNEPAQIEAIVCPLNTGCAGKKIEDNDFSRKQTIDLKEKLKLDKSFGIAEDSEIYAAERQIRKYNSYRKRLVDAFTYKRRVAKEYERLAIWFGDAEISPEQATLHSLTQAQSSKSFDMKDHAENDTSESEWELL